MRCPCHRYNRPVYQTLPRRSPTLATLSPIRIPDPRTPFPFSQTIYHFTTTMQDAHHAAPTSPQPPAVFATPGAGINTEASVLLWEPWCSTQGQRNVLHFISHGEKGAEGIAHTCNANQVNWQYNIDRHIPHKPLGMYGGPGRSWSYRQVSDRLRW